MTAKRATRDTATTQPILPSGNSADGRFFYPLGFCEVIGHELGFCNATGFGFECKGFAVGADEKRVIRTWSLDLIRWVPFGIGLLPPDRPPVSFARS